MQHGTTAPSGSRLKPLLLIVEDDPINRQILNGIAGNMGCRTVLAANGLEAINKVAKQRPDLILLDVIMEGLDGYELCRKFKGNPETREIPIIFISSLTKSRDEERGLALGAVDYIFKPFTAGIVRARINTQLELKRHRDRLEELVAERTLELRHALSKLKTLRGLLPICASCKKIRDDHGNWNRIEDYISRRSEAEFSHGICPDCARKLNPELYGDLR